MSEHTWFQENIAGYTAGGLSVEERERFGRHRVACAACAKILTEAEGLDRSLDNLFATVRPTAGWENRVVDRLRLSGPRRGIYASNIARIVAGIAAMLVLGTLGAFLQGFVGAGDLAFPGVQTQYAAATSKDHETGAVSSNLLKPLGSLRMARQITDAKEGEAMKETDVLERDFAKARSLGREGNAVTRGETSQIYPPVDGQVTWNDWGVKDQSASLPDDAEIKDQMSLLAKENSAGINQANSIEFFPPALALIVRDPSRVHTSPTGGLMGGKGARKDLISDLDMNGGKVEKTFSDLSESLPISTGESLNRQSDRVRVLAVPPGIAGEASNRLGESAPANLNAPTDELLHGLSSFSNGTQATFNSSIVQGLKDQPTNSAAWSKNQSSTANGRVFGRSGGARVENEVVRSGTEAYYKPLFAVNNSTKSDTKAADIARVNRSNTSLTDLAQAREPAKGAKTQAPPKEPAQPESAPDTAARKIIRTGEIDFEVDSFDAAVAGITRTVNSIKGAFVTTVNSDKLPNGKVKGSMVVRLPPERLDSFLLSIRQDLAKIGELKSQRIGSQDVTKQYTDVQSRLRGARAMEERFLQIIKTGKGEIKDLIAAENALGSWRLKIEEMEGEIRFYNNQVGLSTLTITLVEKEIQAPAALIVTQRVKIQLEVDDVDKARQAALEAVNEAKGRITKSELKQHAAGQLEAILHFEVAPAAADSVRDKLKGLGVVTHQDADRIEQTEGAGTRNLSIKVKQNDVKFEVGMYNVANIQPREVLVIQIASLDVPAGFRKLQESAAKAKAQVRTAQLNEQDKVNVSAQFDFDIPSTDKKMIDGSLSQVGVILGRNATQAPPGEAATDRKVGYRLTLRNVAALPAREKISLGIEVKDVKQAVADILDIVKSRQGYAAGSQVNKDRSGQDSAVVIFDVPLDAKAELIRHLESSGKVFTQTATRNSHVPDNKLATAHFDVRLSSATPIVPSDEGLWPQIRTSLFYSFKLLSWSLMCIIVALAVVLPWVVLIWMAYKLISKWRRRTATGSAT